MVDKEIGNYYLKIYNELGSKLELGIDYGIAKVIIEDITKRLSLASSYYDEIQIAYMMDYDPTKGPNVMPYLKEYNKELIEGLLSFMGLFRLVEFEPELFTSKYEKILTERGIEALMQTDIIHTSLSYGRHNNIYDDTMRVEMHNAFTIVGDQYVIKFPDENYLGRKYSPELYDRMRLDCYSVICKLYLALERYGEAGIESDFRDNLFQAWLFMFKFLDSNYSSPTYIYNRTMELIKEKYGEG